MKTFIKNISLFFTAVLLLSMTGCSSSKNIAKLDSGGVERLIQNQSFTFVANQMIPMRGRSRVLTDRYDVKIDTTGVTSYLPYFGQAYGGTDVYPTKSPLDFNSKDFTYSVLSPTEKKNWQIEIKPKDHTGVLSMTLTVFSNGKANLNITNLHRDPITFYGYLQPNS